eukprot:scaffold277422_cov19-Tisochrysis_lutea.AAC.1
MQERAAALFAQESPCALLSNTCQGDDPAALLPGLEWLACAPRLLHCFEVREQDFWVSGIQVSKKYGFPASRALSGKQGDKVPDAQMRTATVTYEGLPSIVQPNDIVYVGRYLAGGGVLGVHAKLLIGRCIPIKQGPGPSTAKD